MASPENIRFYAAGYLGGAITLARAGAPQAASILLDHVRDYMKQPTVDTPPPLLELLAKCQADPVSNIGNIGALEAMFVHDANTMLEQAGIRFGNA